tara:strand:+ start:373 stop:612 length:240 start_codon:yes stop_codon:yes gene_type:complete
MEPTLNSIAISSLKSDLKEIGDLTVGLCGSSNPDPKIRSNAQKINKLAHQMYELVLMEENSRRKELTMPCFEGDGVSQV